jgi:hypothetical protein
MADAALRLARAQEEQARATRLTDVDARVTNNMMSTHSSFTLNRFILSGCGLHTSGPLPCAYPADTYPKVLLALCQETNKVYSTLSLNFELCVCHFKAAVRGQLTGLPLGSFVDVNAFLLLQRRSKFLTCP